ncbi:uncharacterized protein LOC112552814 [Pogonomyrmex barbatus]|uniref:Uncharacterized protein LOC112552814 n=1 Tax=Pogonomyrmex barbatus TaxID=144034 RepID=A0A8N1S7B5_9HYME|nr:uncharacterized protein LOC112552814 [Pogonomyrmex barbatus]
MSSLTHSLRSRTSHNLYPRVTVRLTEKISTLLNEDRVKFHGFSTRPTLGSRHLSTKRVHEYAQKRAVDSESLHYHSVNNNNYLCCHASGTESDGIVPAAAATPVSLSRVENHCCATREITAYVNSYQFIKLSSGEKERRTFNRTKKVLSKRLLF